MKKKSPPFRKRSRKRSESKQEAPLESQERLPNSTPPFRGTLRMNPRGFGFVISDSPQIFPEDAFIAKHLLEGAVDGDIVEVELFPKNTKDKGPEGKILSVLQRGRSQLAALVSAVEPSGIVVFRSPLLGANRILQSIGPADRPLRYGDRVIVRIIDWGDKRQPVLCEIDRFLGSIEDASVDNVAAAEEFQIRRDFPESVIKEAKRFGKTVKKSDCQGRLDLTDTECFTIDPSTAKDFDDALSLEKDSEGNYRLGVHIADVAHYVKPKTALDLEAFERCNSTYFPGTCYPMLPEELSNNLCSLKPNVIRLCISVLLKFDKEGNLLEKQIRRTFIRSAKRFTYEEAKEVLDGKKRSKHKPTLQRMVDLCLLLKKKRSERGSIDFCLPEVVFELDGQGNPVSYKITEYDITHQLVEEYMLKANEITAQSLSGRPIPPVFRVHEEPAQENKEDFFTLARSFGFFLPEEPSNADLQKLFEEVKNTPYAEQLSVAFIRSMKLALYSSENVGHYGLALEEYCHFTSPIRRYPDLVIQRMLFGEHPVEDKPEDIAQKCSEKERISFKAEQSVKTLKKLRFLVRKFQEDPTEEYLCKITKVKPFALCFELPPVGIEGSLHVSEIRGDYFLYEPIRNRFVGRRTGKQFCVGDTIRVRLLSVDLVLSETRWERVLESDEPSDSRKKKKREKGKK